MIWVALLIVSETAIGESVISDDLPVSVGSILKKDAARNLVLILEFLLAGELHE